MVDQLKEEKVKPIKFLFFIYNEINIVCIDQFSVIPEMSKV